MLIKVLDNTLRKDNVDNLINIPIQLPGRGEMLIDRGNCGNRICVEENQKKERGGSRRWKRNKGKENADPKLATRQGKVKSSH